MKYDMCMVTLNSTLLLNASMFYYLQHQRCSIDAYFRARLCDLVMDFLRKTFPYNMDVGDKRNRNLMGNFLDKLDSDMKIGR
jgi:hypothetical protein